jgi:hypothetical protein
MDTTKLAAKQWEYHVRKKAPPLPEAIPVFGHLNVWKLPPPEAWAPEHEISYHCWLCSLSGPQLCCELLSIGLYMFVMRKGHVSQIVLLILRGQCMA